MLRRTASDPGEIHEAIRGGHGRALRVEVLAPGEMAGVRTAALLTLEPGTSIGEHQHTDSEELYLVLEGTGTGLLDSDRFPVGPGDAWVCRSGHSHGLEAGAGAPLRFLALLT
ncbi:MAG TPA: cupin domain-containing protein [Thermoanaerobaculaceae bacterium]|nr:cupin domain-containing protein [Thermoanaerobaculaceae bacterium]HPS76879.1 cupin domain-containing protein [Thermoanaerobaculaceae bacterium]